MESGESAAAAVAAEAAPARRLSVRNTPTLRSATRELQTETRDEPAATAAEPTAPPDAEPEPERTTATKPSKPACARKRGREAIEDDRKQVSDAPPEKIKRTREKWSLFDKAVFFEALNEFGKNFEMLQNYVAKKKSKNGSDQVRNRDQIRFFYYRTINKISKYVTFPADVKRSVQEIYLLVNYGELRKRATKLNERTGQRLSELVYRGTTAIRLRGKTYRVRTPVCRALKKINKIQDPVEEPFVRLPARAQLELTPADNFAWYRVQAVSHNPRLRVSLPLQHRLRTLLLALERRWRDDTHRALESAFPDRPPPPPSRRLALRAAADYKLSAQVIRPAPPAPVLNLCFQRYMERVWEPPPAQRKPAPPKPVPALPTIPDKGEPVAHRLETADVPPPLPPQPVPPDCFVRLDFRNVLEGLQPKEDGGRTPPGADSASNGHLNSEDAANGAPVSAGVLPGDELLSPVDADSQSSVEIVPGELTKPVPPCIQLENSNSREGAAGKDQQHMDQAVPEHGADRESIGAAVAENGCGQERLLQQEGDAVPVAARPAGHQEHERRRETAARRREEAQRRDQQEAERRELAERARLRQQRLLAERCQRSELDRGWTAETAGTRTIGELYMMVDRPEKIKLQYFWLPENHIGHLPLRGQEVVEEPCADAACSIAAEAAPPPTADVPSAETVLSEAAPGGPTEVTPSVLSECGAPNGTAGAAAEVPDVGGDAAVDSEQRRWAAQLVAGRSLVGRFSRHSSADARKVKMLTSLLGQLLSVARLSKAKLDRSRPDAVAHVATQTMPAPLAGREPLYFVSPANRAAGVDPLRRPVRIAPYKTVPPPVSSSDGGEMKPPLEAALRMLPKYNNRRGRPGSRKSQVVVQRMLPLMPRAQPNQISMVNLRLVTGASQTAGSFLPVSTSGQPAVTVSMPMVSLSTPGATPTTDAASTSQQPTHGNKTLGSEEGAPPVLHIPDAPSPEPPPAADPPPPAPPPPPPAEPDEFSLSGAPSDLLMDITLANSNSSFSGLLTSLGRNGLDATLQTPLRPLCENSLPQNSPPASPHVWNEMGDFSLSSILGHLETSKPGPKESLMDPVLECDDPGEREPCFSGGGQGLPTSFQFSGLVSTDPGGQSPPT